MVDQKPFYQTERKPMIGFLGLADREHWPKAESSKCSIFEALDVVGQALLGAEWTGQELAALHWPMAPSAAEQIYQHNLERQTKLPKPIGSRPGIRIPGREGPAEHVAEYFRNRMKVAREEAVAAEQALWDANCVLVARLNRAVEWIATKCRDGELVSYCRFVSGGRLVAIEPHEWNVEYPVARFLANGMYNRWFLNLQPPKQWDVYVFFDRSTLEQAIAGLAHAPIDVPTADLSRLSPYLQLAVKLAMSKGYFSDAEDETQPIREAEVKAAWSQALPDVPWSETAGQAIAKVMGFPNVVAIQQGQRARAGK